MKRKTLEKITNGKYYVNDDGCILTERGKKICNFWIKKLTFNRNLEKNVSFTVDLKFADEIASATIPLCYYYEPLNWLAYGFDIEQLEICCSPRDFEATITEIMLAIRVAEESNNEECHIGWDFAEVNPNTLYSISESSFGIVDNPSEEITVELRTKPKDYVLEYSALVNENVSIPLISYMLLSLLNSFDLLGENIYPNFFASVTGGKNASARKKTALFFTNLFKRRADLRSNYTDLFHFQPNDSAADLRFKAEYQKDCVLIASEPDKRRCNFLANHIYAITAKDGFISVDEERPVRSSCLITSPSVTDIPFETFNIALPEDFDIESMVTVYFNLNDPIQQTDDRLTETIYYFINQLIRKRVDNRFYVNDAYKQFDSEFRKKSVDDSFSEKAIEVSSLLCFAYRLFIDNFYEDADKMLLIKLRLKFQKYKEIICRIAKNSYPKKNYVTDTNLETAKELCIALDNYFEKKTHHIYARMLGAENAPVDPCKLWYDEECFYISASEIADILKIQGSRHKISKKTKIALAEMGLIKTYQKADGAVFEYSVHIQKPLFGQAKTQRRYIAFQRENCRKLKLFTNLESLCK